MDLHKLVRRFKKFPLVQSPLVCLEMLTQNANAYCFLSILNYFFYYETGCSLINFDVIFPMQSSKFTS